MIITTITRILPCYIVRKYSTLAQIQELRQQTGESFRKVQEPLGSRYYKANNHPNLSTPDGSNTTATHSDVIKENGITILSDFLSFTDLNGVRRQQNEILRSTGIQCVDFTEEELARFDHREVLRWAFLAHFRKNHVVEYCKLQTTLKGIIRSNPTLTKKQILREVQLETDRVLIKEYQEQGFLLTKDSPFWNVLF